MTGTKRDEPAGASRERHEPVLLQQVVEHLALGPGLVFVDGTVGSGGHFSAVIPYLSPGGVALGLDRDGEAIERTRLRLEHMDLKRVEIHLAREAISELRRVVTRLELKHVNRVLLDLGCSLEQLLDPGRGFSFLNDGPLDMRQDRRQALTAEEVVNGYPPEDLLRILWDYGEERFARRIVEAIVSRRKRAPFRSTLDLAVVIKEAVPGGGGRTHPATRTFQAIRIEVGQELEEIRQGLSQAAELLSLDGRLAVLTFHGLEERTVKQALRPYSRHGGRTDWQLNALTKVIEPAPAEVASNPRSRSAKLRVFGKLVV